MMLLRARLGAQQSALGRKPVPLGGPADAILFSLSPQRKEGALRVNASGDPAAARQFKWSLEDLAATGLHPFGGRVDVADVEVIKPEWDGHCGKFGEHAADHLPAGGERLIRLRRTGFGVRFLPAEKFAVEGKRLPPVGG